MFPELPSLLSLLLFKPFLSRFLSQASYVAMSVDPEASLRTLSLSSVTWLTL